MIHVLVNAPNPEDATSFYRGYGPLARLSRQNKICMIPADQMKPNWVTMSMADVVFVQRPFTEQHLDFIASAKSCNRKVVIDYDDDLFNVPQENPAYGIYYSDDVKKRVATMISLADEVIVSTEHLKNIYSLYAKKITVINNGWNPDFMSEPLEKRNNVALWRGSASHMKDIFEVKEKIIRLVQEFSETNFKFIAYNPWFIQDRIKVDYEQGKTIDFYFKYVKKLAPVLFHVPLCSNEFNRSKSNIAWIEATHAGAITIAPKMPEWDNGCMLNYENASEYQRLISDVLKGKVNVKSYVKKSYDYILQNLHIDDLNKKRLEVLSV